jgi:hypothetical protein
MSYSMAQSLVDTMLPLGVYWPGEYVYRNSLGKVDWPKVEEALTQSQGLNVNSIWLTHMYAGDTAEFARRADLKGIKLVASIGTIAGEIASIRKGNHQKIIRDTLTAWGNAPDPLAFGLGDEPRTAYMNEMKTYVNSWRRFAPNQSVTTVVTRIDRAAAMSLNLSALTVDVYPFFSPGNPNAFAGHASHAFQYPYGPYQVDSKGNLILLPGGAPHWSMPTPNQIRWQTFAAFSQGIRGMFYFAYRWPVRSSPNRTATNLPAVVNTAFNTTSPQALVYPDGTPTPQLLAVGEAFSWIKRHYSLLQASIVRNFYEANVTRYVRTRNGVLPKRGQTTRVFEDCRDGSRYMMVVNHYSDQSSVGNFVESRVSAYMTSFQAQ